MGLRHLVETEAREVGVPELEDAGAQREEAAVVAHVPELRERAQETARGGARQAGGTSDIAEREFRMLGVKSADHRETACKRLHEIRTDRMLRARLGHG